MGETSFPYFIAAGPGILLLSVRKFPIRLIYVVLIFIFHTGMARYVFTQFSDGNVQFGLLVPFQWFGQTSGFPSLTLSCRGESRWRRRRGGGPAYITAFGRYRRSARRPRSKWLRCFAEGRQSSCARCFHRRLRIHLDHTYT